MSKTLLLADDSVTIQKVVGISFASEDVTLVTVDNGEDAIAKARELRPDAILADVVMPGKNGYEVCEAVKGDPSLQHIPVLLLTGTFEAFDEERAQRCGAAGHVAKPFEAQTLVERVRDLLANPPAPGGPPPAQAGATPPPAAGVQATPPPQAAPAPLQTPAAPPPAASAPPPAPGPDSFDFFEDDLEDLSPQSPPVAAPAAAPSGGGSGPAIDDSAFDFGEPAAAPRPAAPPTMPPMAPGPQASPRAAQQAMAGPQAEATMAVMPPDADESAAPTRLEGFDPSADSDTTAEDLLPGPAVSDEAFDFDVLGDSLTGEPLGGETVLDPQGSSGYDISSSDLGDPLAIEPPPPAATAPPRPPAAPVRSDDETIAQPSWESDTASMPPEPPRGATTPGVSAAVDALFEDEPIAATQLDDALTEDFGSQPEPAGDPVVLSATHDTSAVAGVSLAEITPRLRAQLHDTLEKVAWDSFGDVTEQIVRQALERVEQIAWEVIPHMAETLIREEIRRMKGETKG